MGIESVVQEPSSQSTSTNLLRRVISGDQEAWSRFASIYGAFIYARCRQCGVKPEDAADVMQNVLRRVFLSIAGLRRDEAGQGLRPWLRTITQNAINDHFRRLNKEREISGMPLLPETLNSLFVAPEPETESFGGDPSLVLLVRSAVATVKLDYETHTWEAFWRTAVEQQRCVDVAADMHLSKGTVRQAKHKILKRLRQELNGLF